MELLFQSFLILQEIQIPYIFQQFHNVFH